jgi:hypothetical protein
VLTTLINTSLVFFEVRKKYIFILTSEIVIISPVLQMLEMRLYKTTILSLFCVGVMRGLFELITSVTSVLKHIGQESFWTW